MNRVINIDYYNTPFGELIMGSFEEQLCICDWRYRKMRTGIDKRIQSGLDAVYEEGETLIIVSAKQQLEEYFSGDREEFNIKLLMVGTSFQHTIWNELVKVPYGETETYLGLSQKINNEKAIRAVAAANGANALAIFVPCHRIIGSKGELVGYAGGLGVKKKLLQLENIEKYPEQLNLFE